MSPTFHQSEVRIKSYDHFSFDRHFVLEDVSPALNNYEPAKRRPNIDGGKNKRHSVSTFVSPTLDNLASEKCQWKRRLNDGKLFKSVLVQKKFHFWPFFQALEMISSYPPSSR